MVFLATKKGKKARKQLSSLLIKDLKESFEKGAGQSNSKADVDDESHLFQLIRGVPTVMISRGENEDGLNFRPLKPKSISSVEEIGDGEKYAKISRGEHESCLSYFPEDFTPLPRTLEEFLKDKDK
jgi:hypothetical protein